MISMLVNEPERKGDWGRLAGSWRNNLGVPPLERPKLQSLKKLAYRQLIQRIFFVGMVDINQIRDTIHTTS